ncbi:hypothetical protein K5I29_08400 [Flavobacterium agricola]|uniref:DUF4890 domain-containing protein n=1 Tax=Flavobacterium agricola TaxID=2870839 RepID=A0ABY6LYT0_9FLAO|nr:hypothetical protein [Flavobacterium agricola]UYW00564.1 hypothetical protein K5I29_08400 [Flavobacterium agricola]
MKRIIVLAAIALFSFEMNAQEVKTEVVQKEKTEKTRAIKAKRAKIADSKRNHAVNRKQNIKLTAEQRNDLRVKQLTLALNLSDKQQNKVAELNAKTFNQDTKFVRGKKLTNDEVYNLKAERLDKQIAYKRGMKKILSKNQFAQWENMNKENSARYRQLKHKNNRNFAHKPKTENNRNRM